MKHTKLLFG